MGVCTGDLATPDMSEVSLEGDLVADFCLSATSVGCSNRWGNADIVVPSDGASVAVGCRTSADFLWRLRLLVELRLFRGVDAFWRLVALCCFGDAASESSITTVAVCTLVKKKSLGVYLAILGNTDWLRIIG